MEDVLNVGIIGAGRIGCVHAENLAHRTERARVLMIADMNESAARRLASRLGVPGAAADYREVLENRDIQAVLVCSATDTHARIAVEAAAAGKHVFCEKPIAHSLADIDRVLEAAGRARSEGWAYVDAVRRGLCC
ncbi:MAG: Gfo/Idh/MocA family oxidoreductase [Acidobacteriota bacterium]